MNDHEEKGSSYCNGSSSCGFTVCTVFAANSPGTGVVIPNEDSDGDYDIGERVDQVTGGSSSASGTGNSSAATPGDRPQPRLRFPLKAEQPARAAARP